MEQKKKYKIVVLLAIFLVVVCVAEGFVIYRGHIELYASDDADQFSVFDKAVELDNFTVTLVTSAPSWTPIYANLSLFVYEGFDRMFKTQWDFE
mgnify:CR=1 FL=1